jgi:hypothetical protein
MTITQEWIIKYVIHDVIGYIMDDIQTGLYSESAGYLYDLYKSERK